MTKNILNLLLIALGVLSLAGCGTSSSFISNYNDRPYDAISPNESLTTGSRFWQGSTTTVWNRLQQVPIQKLLTADSNDPIIAGWTQLAIISKQDGLHTSQLIPALTAWRAQFPKHPGNQLFPNDSILMKVLNTSPPNHIAILLPLSGSVGQQGKIVRNGYLNTYYANKFKNNAKQTVSFYDTTLDPNITIIYQKAINEGADFIVGPLTKDKVQELLNYNSFSRPTLALNYTDLGFGSLPTNFYQFGLSPLDEAQQLADKAHSEGHTRALIIATQNEWGQRVVNELSARYKSDGGKIQEILYVTPQTDFTKAIASLLKITPHVDKNNKPLDNDKLTLEKERRHDFDTVFLLTPPKIARQIMPLFQYYYVTNVSVYASSIVYSGTPSPQQDTDIDGVTFLDIPWVLHSHGKQATRLYAVGADAYTISNELPRLTQIPNFPIYGATGAMTLNSKHQIYRRLPWTTMRNGQPQH